MDVTHAGMRLADPQLQAWAEQYAAEFGIPASMVVNALIRETGVGIATNGGVILDRNIQSGVPEVRGNIAQLHSNTWPYITDLQGNRVVTNPADDQQAIRGMAAALFTTGTGGFFAPINPDGTGGSVRGPYGWDPIAALIGYNSTWRKARDYIEGTISGANPLAGLRPQTINYIWQVGQGLTNIPEAFNLGTTSLPSSLAIFSPWATPSEMREFVEGAQALNLNWADREALDPTQISSAFKQDPTGWYLDPNVLKTTQDLTAKEGAYLQSVGVLDPKFAFDLGSGTWQDTGGAGGWSLMNTSNPDVIESKLFEQWLPKGFQAAGPEVWGDTPLQFWVPDWSTDLLPSGASLQSGQAPFDLFNPQGQFDVNMLNAPGAVSPELGGWLQQQGIVNPSKGYNPVDQVWQDAPPAPGWQLMDVNQYSQQAIPQLQQYFQQLFPTEDFTGAFEGIGGFSQPNAIMNWVPPAPQGSQYTGTMGVPSYGPGAEYEDIPGDISVQSSMFAAIPTPAGGYGSPQPSPATVLSQQYQAQVKAQSDAFLQAQVDAFNQQQAQHNQQMLNQGSNPWGGGWQPGFGLLY